MKNRTANKDRHPLEKMVFGFFLIVAMNLAQTAPTAAQIWRGRAGGAFEKKVVSLERESAIASRTAKLSTRLTVPSVSRSVNVTRSTMTNVSSALRTVKVNNAGTMSISTGKIGRKNPVVKNNPLLNRTSIASGTTVSSARTSQAKSVQELSEIKTLMSNLLAPQMREKVGAAVRAAELNAQTAKTRTLQAQFLEKSRVFGGANAIKLPFHKNSNKYFGLTHLYEIRSKDGIIHKYGESAGPVINGKSLRAEKQVADLYRKNPGKVYESRIREYEMTKKGIRRRETRKIISHREEHGKDSLPGNLGNR